MFISIISILKSEMFLKLYNITLKLKLFDLERH